MKLIIDIPENEYRHIKEYYEKNDIVEATYSYIYHGIPLNDVLDKIRAEIESNRNEWIKGKDPEWHTYDRCLSIIDKYRGKDE